MLYSENVALKYSERHVKVNLCLVETEKNRLVKPAYFKFYDEQIMLYRFFTWI